MNLDIKNLFDFKKYELADNFNTILEKRRCFIFLPPKSSCFRQNDWRADCQKGYYVWRSIYEDYMYKRELKSLFHLCMLKIYEYEIKCIIHFRINHPIFFDPCRFKLKLAILNGIYYRFNSLKYKLPFMIKWFENRFDIDAHLFFYNFYLEVEEFNYIHKNKRFNFKFNDGINNPHEIREACFSQIVVKTKKVNDLY